MIKYVSKTIKSLVVKIDTDKEDVDAVNSIYCDYMYWVPEDGEWTITREDGTKETVPVTKGTLVLKFYPANDEISKEREFVFINNDHLKSYYERHLQYNEKRKMKEKVEINSGCYE